MKKIKIFISSVQSEFVTERQILYDYLTTDALLGKFFEPFIFEKLPATDQNSNQVYLKEVGLCDIYLGLFGKDYGCEDKNGISPTEHEFMQEDVFKTVIWRKTTGQDTAEAPQEYRRSTAEVP